MPNYPVRARLPHDVPHWVDDGSFYFITVNCDPRDHNHLARAGVGDAVLASAAFYHEHLRWHCRIMLLMPDHLHGIIAFPRKPGMKRMMTQWKRYLTRNHKVDWQRDFFDHRIRDHHELAEKTDYILKIRFEKDCVSGLKIGLGSIARMIDRHHCQGNLDTSGRCPGGLSAAHHDAER